MPEPQDLIAERPAEGVLLLRLNRPERRNALATPLLCALAEAIEAADGDDAVRLVVLTGSDKVFAAGADINELAVSGPDDPIDTPRFRAWAAIRAFTKPLIAAVEGWCLGAGAELMMCTDIVVAGKGAKIGLPETNLGIIPGAGGTATLPRRVGQARALDMVLTGEPIGAEQAQAIGLIARLAEQGEALADALALAEKLAARAPLALRAAKSSIRAAADLDEDAHLRAERVHFIRLLGTADKAEGIAAFQEKRAPVWQGR
ncbi:MULTISPECIES: enoyl-CoA hydratase-related protein [unclassified Sphingomonas]|uniref:enoyl-CoA hydratase-related protein n=1 Tax=unclassified Sphingomonas TaxID=196159 RepID=UPI0006FBF459|nr:MULTISPECIES: enoyl-CoA hydratase-related protein [unclassified Sphingomonas]KQX18690.1 2,3-dehydroadipyl-CoA hydratase [Sphingomonas sp. Root1294]KQY71987.1 2,3-dehydroadipyl-CoA hydratase [Sphingomonas sp. Root50]KRB94747.1 2,3-dehydroadipyl-CoA hydratase [Sphingomonas sp. Root720]